MEKSRADEIATAIMGGRVKIKATAVRSTARFAVFEFTDPAPDGALGSWTLDSLKEAAGWWVEWNAERYGVVAESEPARIFVPGPLEHARWVAARLSDGWPGQNYAFYVVGDPESDEEDCR